MGYRIAFLLFLVAGSILYNIISGWLGFIETAVLGAAWLILLVYLATHEPWLIDFYGRYGRRKKTMFIIVSAILGAVVFGSSAWFLERNYQKKEAGIPPAAEEQKSATHFPQPSPQPPSSPTTKSDDGPVVGSADDTHKLSGKLKYKGFNEIKEAGDSPIPKEPPKPPTSPPPSSIGNIIGNKGIITQGQTGGQNTIINERAPKRTIDNATASLIAGELRNAGTVKFTLVDYSGGQDQETYEYKERISSILKSAGWVAEGFEGKAFQQVGGQPLLGVHIATRKPTDPILPNTLLLWKVLKKYNVQVANEIQVAPLFFESDDTVGVLIGRRPE